MEPEKYLPMNRAELIARVEALEAALREIVALGDCDNSASKMYFVARRFANNTKGKDCEHDS